MERGTPAAHAPSTWSPALPVTTDRLILRRHELRDLDDLVRFHSDPDTVRYLPWPVRDRDQTLAALEKKLDQHQATADGEWIVLAVEERASGEVIGELDLKRAGDGRAELGYVIRRDRQGRGLAREAVIPLLRYAFEKLDLDAVDAFISPGNAASTRFAERLGFRREPFRDNPHGDNPTLAFTLTREAWAEAPATAITVRPYRPTDAAATLEIFVTAILRGARDAYTDEQRLAWLGDNPRAPRWHEERAATRTFVAEISGVVVGFTDLGADGYIDRLFVHPSATRRGVGRRLLHHVVALAESEGMPRVCTNASRVARPVLERAGFVVDHAETVERAGVALERFAMHRDL
ncbi:GNAT family N-acetyltransferase [Microbacterium oryzae]|uniref:GNAT family N-acetyltransferase n=1 Tax=Microbacterium oryzae TaxID=743009 RepID=UPI0025B155A0|nr:GNAT family N-acetyltransferase [Microbacterium oryzae]MDN3310444.1 GNAT family N-acetyltransferase [Microbacterium oryzae]